MNGKAKKLALLSLVCALAFGNMSMAQTVTCTFSAGGGTGEGRLVCDTTACSASTTFTNQTATLLLVPYIRENSSSEWYAATRLTSSYLGFTARSYSTDSLHRMYKAQSSHGTSSAGYVKSLEAYS